MIELKKQKKGGAGRVMVLTWDSARLTTSAWTDKLYPWSISLQETGRTSFAGRPCHSWVPFPGLYTTIVCISGDLALLRFNPQCPKAFDGQKLYEESSMYPTRPRYLQLILRDIIYMINYIPIHLLPSRSSYRRQGDDLTVDQAGPIRTN